MNKVELGEIIATRMLSLDNQPNIVVRIGRPLSPPDWNENFCCPYQISGIGSERIQRAGGVDSMQALYLALQMVATDLYTSNEGQARRISWNGEKDLGFPVLEIIRGLMPK